MAIHAKYLLKTALYGLSPSGVGYYRRLHQHKNPAYNHDRDKHPLRHLHTENQGWEKTTASLHRRHYNNYNEYLTHQKQKFAEAIQMYGGFKSRVIARWRRRFYRRFRHLTTLLPKDAIIVCLGARQGTEVEVLRDLGFKNAYGIDLNPGPDNPYVIPGDFMHLQEAPSSVDCLYSNSIDHAFDLDAFLAEHMRVLKPTGYAMYDLPRYSTTRSPGAFEAIGWDDEKIILDRILPRFEKVILTHTEPKWQWLLLHKPKKS